MEQHGELNPIRDPFSYSLKDLIYLYVEHLIPYVSNMYFVFYAYLLSICLSEKGRGEEGNVYF